MFFVNNFYGLAMSQCHRVFLFLRRYPILRLTSSLLRCECARGGAAAGWIEMQRNCRRGQRRALQEIFAIVFFFFFVDIPYFDSHLHCCGVSVPGEARLRGGLRRSQNAEKLQAWAEARAARNFRHRVFLFMLMAVKRNGTACGRRGLG